MHCASRLGACLGVALAAAQALAAGTDAKAVAEIDAQLAKLAPPPPELDLVFDPLENARYKLLSAAFELDGKPLPFDAKHPVAPLYRGQIEPGDHSVSAKLVYNEAQGSGLFEYEDYKITVASTVDLVAQKGLRSHVHLVVKKHDAAPAKQRLSVGTQVESEMLTPVDDSPVPQIAMAAKPTPAAPPPVLAEAEPAKPAKSSPEPASDEPSSESKRAVQPRPSRPDTTDQPAPPLPAVAAPAPDAGVVAPPPPVAPSPTSEPQPAEVNRDMVGFALIAAGIVVALAAVLFFRRKK